MLSIGDNPTTRTNYPAHLLSRKWVWFLIYSLVLIGAVLWGVNQKTQAPIAYSSTKPSAKVLIPTQNQESVAQWHVFGKQEPKVTELEQSKWQLQGIIMSPEHEGVAILQVNNKTLTLKAGDTISSNVTIDKIEQDKILVLDNGQLKSLTLFKPSQTSQASSVASKRSQGNTRTDKRAFSGLAPDVQQRLQNLRNNRR